MGVAVLVGIALVFFALCYVVYGGYLAKVVKLDPNAKTPASKYNDGIDYVPAKAPVLLGHHFASIAGGGPIVGPIVGAAFGWLPAYLWILIGSAFAGGVHDFMALISSARNDGKSIGEVIGRYVGRRARLYFLIFVWLALILVIAVFTVLVAKTFTSTPQVATSSLILIAIAVGAGFALYQMRMPLGIVTLIGLALLAGGIWFGYNNPLQLPFTTWVYILVAYIFAASALPVWVLLQPRDYLNSYLLYVSLAVASIGVILGNPSVQYPTYTSFYTKLGPLFPILFVVVACGAISGFHSLVSSGTTSKQLAKETDAKPIGYGGMLIEGLLAVIALSTVLILTQKGYVDGLKAGGPVKVFAMGFGSFAAYLGIPAKLGMIFGALTISGFLLTSLDTAARLGRYAFEELFSDIPALSNRYTATIVTVIAGGALAISGQWKAIWPVFGASNQLLAGLALLAATVWLARNKMNDLPAKIPMWFMVITTIVALVILIQKNFSAGKILLGVTATILLVLALFMVWEALKALKGKEQV